MQYGGSAPSLLIESTKKIDRDHNDELYDKLSKQVELIYI